MNSTYGSLNITKDIGELATSELRNRNHNLQTHLLFYYNSLFHFITSFKLSRYTVFQKFTGGGGNRSDELDT